MTCRVFYIDFNGVEVVVKKENGDIFYRARNREINKAIAECYAYMSSFLGTILYDNINKKGRRNEDSDC